MAPRVGFEPTTCRLTVGRSTAELSGNTVRVYRVGCGARITITLLSRKLFFKKNQKNESYG